MLPFIALSSSRGTTLRAILERIANGSLPAQCLGLVTDRADRGCIAVAEEFGVPVVVVPKVKGEERETYDRKLHEAILSLSLSPSPGTGEGRGGGRLVLCAVGWMWLLSPWFVNEWQDKIINVHPSLLPKYPGAHAHRDVLAAGEIESGMTIHLIDDGVDSGKILIQKSCPVLPDDTEDTLKARVQELEKEWYPEVLRMIADGTISLA